MFDGFLLAEEFEFLLRVRDAVNVAIEPLRREKRAGNRSRDFRLYLTPHCVLHELLLESHNYLLKEVFKAGEVVVQPLNLLDEDKDLSQYDKEKRLPSIKIEPLREIPGFVRCPRCDNMVRTEETIGNMSTLPGCVEQEDDAPVCNRCEHAIREWWQRMLRG